MYKMETDVHPTQGDICASPVGAVHVISPHGNDVLRPTSDSNNQHEQQEAWLPPTSCAQTYD